MDLKSQWYSDKSFMKYFNKFINKLILKKKVYIFSEYNILLDLKPNMLK